MTPTAFLAWCMAVAGCTLIVTTSKLFAGLRETFPHAGPVTARTFLGSVLHCPMCFGWWVGAASSLVGYGPLDFGRGFGAIASAALSGCIASLVAYTWHVVLVRLGSLEL